MWFRVNNAVQVTKPAVPSYENWLDTYRDKSNERQTHFVRKRKAGVGVSNEVKVSIILLCVKCICVHEYVLRCCINASLFVFVIVRH